MRKVGDHYIARNAIVTAEVTIGSGSSIWYNTVIRGDVAPIRIGARVNVQDGALLHCRTGIPLDIADDVVIGHHAVVHCRRVGRRSLIGTRATLLDDVEVGERCIVAAGALVPPGMIIPDGSVVMGLPASIVRAISEKDLAYIDMAIATYLRLSVQYAAGEIPSHNPPDADPA